MYKVFKLNEKQHSKYGYDFFILGKQTLFRTYVLRSFVDHNIGEVECTIHEYTTEILEISENSYEIEYSSFCEADTNNLLEEAASGIYKLVGVFDDIKSSIHLCKTQ